MAWRLECRDDGGGLMAFKRIKSMKLSDYFRYQRNEMVTFRLIPHQSITNNSNGKLWRVLHKMYEIYDKLPSRISRDGFRFTLREKDAIWFDVVFRQDENERKVEFYVSTSALWAKKFREVLENRLKVTIEEADVTQIQVPTENTVVQELQLARHDIFSLGIDHREQTSPIASVMSALEDISEDGDFARLSVCAETFSREQWLKNALYAHEKLSKGKMPQRAKITPNKAIGAFKNALAGTVNELNSLMNDVLQAVSNVFFKNDKGFEADKVVEKAHVLADEIQANKLSTQTQNKLNQPVWKTRIRVAAHTTNRLRADLVCNTIASAFSEISGDNELKAVKIRIKARKERIIEEMNTLHLSQHTKADADVSLLSCDELAKVALQLPTREIQQRYEQELAVNRKVETEIPAVFLDDSGLLIGHSEIRGEQIPIYLPMKNPNEFYRGYVFPGEMGMGKDTAIQNFVVEGSLKHGISFIVIDQVNKEGKQGMANGIRDSLPPEKIIDLDFGNEEYLPPLDLTEVMRKLGRRGADRFANELIDFFDVGDMAQTKSILRVAAKASGGSLLETKRIIEDDQYRWRIAEQLAESNPLLSQDLKSWGEKLARNKVEPILSRLDDFFGDSTLNYIFSQPPKRELDFEQFMREGKVVIIRVPDRVLSTVAVRTLVHWITLKVLMTRLLMDNDSQSNGTFIVYNEPQTYLNEGLSQLIARIATQGRKERLGALIAVQYFEQLGSLTKDLTGGGVNWFLFRNGDSKIYEQLKHRLDPYVTIDDAMATEKWHALNLLNFRGRPQPPFLVRMLAPSYERYTGYDNSFLTKRHCRQYGRNWEEIEQLIIKQRVPKKIAES
jgi:hypothetical protein